MRTVFRKTATLPDGTGKFRTSILLSAGPGPWSDAGKTEFVKREALPCRAYDITDEEFAALEANSDLRFGYSDKAGDIESDFEPTPWVFGF